MPSSSRPPSADWHSEGTEDPYDEPTLQVDTGSLAAEMRRLHPSAAQTLESQERSTDPMFGDLRVGRTLAGRYRLDRTLGRGATGIVYEASHLVIGKRVALKCLYPHQLSEVAVERFFREARIAATVEHPNVVEVFDAGRDGDHVFLAMPLLEGETLADRLDRGSLGVMEAIHIFAQILGGVAAVHGRGVVHRDLKPDNIFLTRGRGSIPSQAKVLDFGISKLKEPGTKEITRLGAVMGTPFYMAPEQITDTRDVDVRADVYSLGVMLYQALSGEVPYPEESVVEIFKRAQRRDAPTLAERRIDVPEALSQVVERAIAPDRDQRFGTVEEMRRELVAIDPEPITAEKSLFGVPDETRPTGLDDFPTLVAPSEAPHAPVDDPSPPPSPQRRVPVWLWLMVAGLGLVAGLGWFVALVSRSG